MLREKISGETKIENSVQVHSFLALTTPLLGPSHRRTGQPLSEALSILISGPPKKDANPQMNLLSAWPKATAQSPVPSSAMLQVYSTTEDGEFLYMSAVIKLSLYGIYLSCDSPVCAHTSTLYPLTVYQSLIFAYLRRI